MSTTSSQSSKAAPIGTRRELFCWLMEGQIGATRHGLPSCIFHVCSDRQTCVTKYAPKNSAFNPIEHGWAPLSKLLTSVRLRSSLEYETEPPATQTITDNQDLNEYWDGKVFDGHTIRSSHHPCLAPGTPYNDYEQIHQLVSAGSRARLQENPELLSEVKFAVQHTQKRPRELTRAHARAALSARHILCGPPKP